ncbi:MAG: hypothetical protein QXY84_04635 [Candidatus Caldarchaeum sp.]
MKVLLAASVVVALFAGAVVSAVFYSAVFSQAIADYQKQIDELLAENFRLQSELTSSRNRVGGLESEVKTFQSLLEAAERRAKELDERVGRLETQLQRLNDENSAVRREVASLRVKMDEVKKVLTQLENDRVILSWIRSGPPDQRQAARDYWNETRSLVAKSNPTLVLTVDKILDSLELYFDWIESAPPLRDTSRAEIIAWCPLYIDWILNAPPGVTQYTESIEQLNQEILLVVISHIDALSKLLEG